MGNNDFYCFLLLVISCAKSDDLETLDETPVDEKSLIIYTDIDPDFITKTPGDSFNLDLNNDGMVDFILKSNSSDPFILIESNPNGVNGIATTSGPFDSYILPLNKNTIIASPDDYYDSYGLLILGCNTITTYCSYDWKNTSNKYLGLRFQIKGQRHYGWARMQVISTSLWVVKDYAYNATPDSYILAGQK